MFTTTFEKLNDNCLILTANNRLKTLLRCRYQTWQQSLGKQVFIPPQIQSWSQFLTDAWHRGQCQGLVPGKLLLDDSKLTYLWQQLVQSHLQDELLIGKNGIAESLLQAIKLINTYQIPAQQVTANLGSNSLLPKLINAFDSLCHENGFVAPWEVGDYLSDYWQQLPHHIYRYGFTDFTEAQKKILDSIKMAGKILEVIDITPQQPSMSLASPSSQYDEWQLMCDYAKAALSQHQTENPLICVVPDLANHRDTLIDIFEKTFADEFESVNISGGTPLAQEGIVQLALTWLGSHRAKYRHEEWTALITSPYLGDSQQEYLARQKLVRALHNIKELSFTRQSLMRFANYAPKLSARLKAQEKFFKSRYQPPSLWAKDFSEELACLAWPGQITIQSREHQALERWDSILKQFSQLDIVNESMNRHQALETLKNLCHKELFQIASKDKPIQVLGLFEAIAMPCQTLWLSGVYEGNWPPAGSMNPFLPIKLQKQYGLPHTSVSQETAFYKKLSEGFAGHCETLIFSFPSHLDEGESHLSPTIKNLWGAIPALNFSKQEAEQTKTEVSYYSDWQAPALQLGEKARGGSQLLKHQGDCPFKGFAKGRLAANRPTTLSPGISPIERGDLLHQSLFYFWQQVMSQEALLALSDDALETTIKTSIQRALDDLRYQKPESKHSKVFTLEAERLLGLLQKWIAYEKTRPIFEIYRLEERIEGNFEDIGLTMQIDRIDKLADGSLLIIDYKTGLTSVSEWLQAPPKSTQLPLYCLSKDNISACAYGMLRANEVTLTGLGDVPDLVAAEIKNPRDLKRHDFDSWQDLKAHWQQQLEELAKDFIAGKAVPMPRDGIRTCNECDCKTLCRIHDWGQEYV